MRKLAVMAVLACAGAGSAWGQLFEVWFNGGQSLLSNKGLGTVNVDFNGVALPGASKNDVELEDGFRFSFRMTLNNESHFGHEVQYAYNRSKLRQPGAPDQGMRQKRVLTPREKRVKMVAYTTRERRYGP